MALPRVGILADDRLQQHLLKGALVNFGFEVVVNTDPQRMELVNFEAIDLDAWVIDLRDDDDRHLHWLDRLLDGDVPVLMGFTRAPNKNCATFPKWEKRLYSKLKELVQVTPLVTEDAAVLGQLSFTPGNHKISLPAVFQQQNFSHRPAKQVWVLGASLGGPAAVKQFLDALPAGLPIAFVYAQHIDPRFEETLANTLGRHAGYTFKKFEDGRALCCGEVLVAPIEKEFSFRHGALYCHGTDWPGPYGPSIDQVILNVDAGFGRHAGYILFSGMGNDGSDAITRLPHDQHKIWAQDPASCANSSMPESALETNRVHYSGTPQQLALNLVNHLKNTWVNHNESITD